MIASRRVVGWGTAVAVLATLRLVLALTQPRFEPPAPLLDFDPSRVDRVRIARGEQAVELVRKGEGWVVASAGDLPAHAGVGALIERLAGWRRERVAGETPRDEWGVGPDRGKRVTLRAGDAVLGELLVGQVTGIEPEDVREVGYALDTDQLGLFVRLPSEDRVYVVTDFVTRELEPDPRRWFAPPVPVEPGQITRLRRGGPEGFDLRAGPFRFANDPTPVDPRRAGSLLGWIPRLRVVGPAEPAQLEGALELVFDVGVQPSAIRLAQRDGRAFLQVGERCLEVEPLPASRLFEGTRSSLIRRRLLLQEPRDVTRLEVVQGSRRAAFGRVRGAWVDEAGAEVEADLDAVIRSLGEVQVEWGEPAVGQTGEATVRVFDAQGQGATLWLLDTGPEGRERIALSGASLVARVQGRPLAEALRTLLGE